MKGSVNEDTTQLELLHGEKKEHMRTYRLHGSGNKMYHIFETRFIVILYKGKEYDPKEMGMMSIKTPLTEYEP